MHVISVANVNEAFWRGSELLLQHGVKQRSRAGTVVVLPEPVVTEYALPQERVLFHSVRDANPVFHLMEALWMLAGRNDATFLDQFVSDFSSRFAEDTGKQHGAYGFRWRAHFDVDGGSEWALDQLHTIVNRLRADPDDRRIVLTMWDPMADLGADKRDVPCNTHLYLRIVNGRLDMTVCCRSNDMWWGAYGSNIVHFSVLQEYMAAWLGVPMGIYRQFSNNFHIYPAVVKGRLVVYEGDPYRESVFVTPIVTHVDSFDEELENFLNLEPGTYHNSFFMDVAAPLWTAYRFCREKHYDTALELIEPMMPGGDWREVMLRWIRRRMARVAEKVHGS